MWWDVLEPSSPASDVLWKRPPFRSSHSRIIDWPRVLRYLVQVGSILMCSSAAEHLTSIAYISSECDVNFVHGRIVYSLESHLVYKIWDNYVNESHTPHVTSLVVTQMNAQSIHDVPVTGTCAVYAGTLRPLSGRASRLSARRTRLDVTSRGVRLASYLKTELLRLKCTRALLDPQLGKFLQTYFKGVVFSGQIEVSHLSL